MKYLSQLRVKPCLQPCALCKCAAPRLCSRKPQCQITSFSNSRKLSTLEKWGQANRHHCSVGLICNGSCGGVVRMRSCDWAQWKQGTLSKYDIVVLSGCQYQRIWAVRTTRCKHVLVAYQTVCLKAAYVQLQGCESLAIQNVRQRVCNKSYRTTTTVWYIVKDDKH